MTETSRLGNAAEYYAGQKWHILPCHGIVGERCTCNDPNEDPKNFGKRPANSNGTKGATFDGATIAGWWATNPNYNIGVFCKPSGFFVIDIDPRSGGDESFEKFEELLDWTLVPTVEAITGVYTYKGKQVRGRHLYYRYEGNEKLIGKFKDSAGLPGIDIKHDGYVLAMPSRHHSGVAYEWKPGHAPWEIEMAQAPEKLMQAIIQRSSGTSKTSYGAMGDDILGDLATVEGIDIERFQREGISEGHRAQDLYKLACSVANKIGVETEFQRSAVETWMIRFNAERVFPPLELEGSGGLLMHVRNAIQYVIDNPKSQMQVETQEWMKDAAQRMQDGTFRSQNIERVVPNTSNGVPDDDDVEDYGMYTAPGTIGGAVNAAAQAGYSTNKATKLNKMDVPPDQDALTAEEGGTPGMRSCSDLGNGRRIVDAFGSVIRYTEGIGWFTWAGSHWKFDQESLNTKEQAKKIASLISAETVNYASTDEHTKINRWSAQSRSVGRINAAVEVAKTDPRVRVAVSQWDGEPHLMGVANGVVDLRTGELLQGRPDLNITKSTPVMYQPGKSSERWNKFLDVATNGDKELQKWLQRAAGYTLTGYNNLDVMFLMYGPPGTGKNTAVEAFVKAMGVNQYAWPLDSAVLAADDKVNRSDEYHMAKLLGKRMVWVDELPEGERIKENQVKKLTGSSEISARSPGESPFSFESQAKLWLTTNHRPRITDDAMWRRIRPIPWLHAPEVMDPTLKEFLFDPQGGLPAVLTWMIEGAIEYLASPEVDGLGWCKAVYDAAEMYRKSEDRIGAFMNEETEEITGGEVSAKTLHHTYQYWCQERGEKPLAYTNFVRKLSDRGYESVGEQSKIVLLGRVIRTRTITSSASDIDWAALGTGNGFEWGR